jgi:hypothetical protein
LTRSKAGGAELRRRREENGGSYGSEGDGGAVGRILMLLDMIMQLFIYFWKFVFVYVVDAFL